METEICPVHLSEDGEDCLFFILPPQEDPGDDIFGTEGVDVINFASNFDDRIFVFGGDDTVFGFNGRDAIVGGAGDDELNGNEGDDFVTGNEGNDVVNGNLDNDLLFGNQGEDTLSGGQGNDTLWGGKDADQLFGNKADDLLFGDIGSDLVSGDQGADTLYGAAPSSSLPGLGEIDVLVGGIDTDTFVLADAGVSFYDNGDPTDSGLDDYAIVFDFNPLEGDKLQLRFDVDYILTSTDPAVFGFSGLALWTDSDGTGSLTQADELVAAFPDTAPEAVIGAALILV
ncbi:hemolysin-type calcium-binding protein [Thalassoporum mexicanum PCC 7367]|uniref:calcium-binding protein n=1 Tax=Thalassoporum mexicanum TaxID=3457544 RepID=UPI00029FCEC6|nr:calcium-binding protein [Pseudanabaena sp. PCC 7367]AFY68347.1 hemolysin-type calcium-binding protein [Pseudanabaena sp. PCC 7367]